MRELFSACTDLQTGFGAIRLDLCMDKIRAKISFIKKSYLSSIKRGRRDFCVAH